jgi:leader peptidase (prepilin peptidase)/N-methyltransferase
MTSLLDPAVALPAAAVIGLCVGSFLNVVIHRLPRMMERDWREQALELLERAGLTTALAPFRHWSATTGDAAPLREPETGEPVYSLASPRSACPVCGHAIPMLQNVPVVSWLVLRGRCAACRAPISPRYPLVELATGVLTVAVVLAFGPTGKALAGAVLVWMLLALAIIDFDTKYLPQDLTMPLLLIGLGLSPFPDLRFAPGPIDSIAGALIGYGLLWTLYWTWRILFRKEGIGQGDFILLAALGAWFGWIALVPLLLIASIIGATIGIGLTLARGRDHRVPLPFGPFLALAGIAVLFAGPRLVRILMP